MEYKIKAEVLVAIIKYLWTKPYNETFELIAGLQTAKEITEPVAGQTKEEKKKK